MRLLAAAKSAFPFCLTKAPRLRPWLRHPAILSEDICRIRTTICYAIGFSLGNKLADFKILLPHRPQRGTVICGYKEGDAQMRVLSWVRWLLATGIALSLSALISFTANAGVFSLTGGNPFNLNGAFNPDWTFSNPDAIGVNTTVRVFDNPGDAAQGLFFTPAGTGGFIFTYLGQEAGYSNQSEATFAYNNTPMFSNHATPRNTSASAFLNVGPADPGLLPFLFASLGYSSPALAINGGPIDSRVALAFFVPTNNSSVAYAFFEDIRPTSAGGDNDFDDMIVKIEYCANCAPPPSVPLPAALPLFATGVGFLGLIGWRKRRKIAATAA